MRLAAGFGDQTTVGAISTEAGPSVKNPAGYHHGTGVVQILIAIRTTTETSTIKARETVASRRILATTQPPIYRSSHEKHYGRENNPRCFSWGNQLRDRCAGRKPKNRHRDVHAKGDHQPREPISIAQQRPDE